MTKVRTSAIAGCRSPVPGPLLLFLAACSAPGAAAFLSGTDNDPAALARARSLEKAPPPGRPANATGEPMAFLVTAAGDGKPRLIAWDLAAKKAVWTVDAQVTSRVVVGRDRVTAREGDALVARAMGDGHVLWTHPLGSSKDTLYGVAADGDRVVYAFTAGTAGAKTWNLVGVGPDGHEAWATSVRGPLGAPAARGGLVYAPFMSQWLDVFDGRNGERVARLRQTDEAVTWTRATADGVFYGSRGVIALDERAVSGQKGKQHYAQFAVPEQAKIGDMEAVPANYSALDRNRVLWRARVDGDALRFADDMTVLLRYRFFFAFDAKTGQIKWAHGHARHDVVAADDDGRAIVYAAADGAIGVLDRATGSVLLETQAGARLMGATFDAEGWRPEGEGAPSKVVDALAAIVADKDARFNSIKVYATHALGSCSGKEVTGALLRILGDAAAPHDVQRMAGEVLAERKDSEGLGDLVKALSVRRDYVSGAQPRGVEALARAAGAIGKPEAGPALVVQLEDPATSPETVAAIAAALATIKAPEAGPALRAYLMTYRTDPAYSGEANELEAVLDALVGLGTPAEHELVVFVAGDPRTATAVAEAARRALGGR